MNVFLENDQLRVGIKSLGAELFSLRNKQNDLEYVWRGDAAFWGKTSPILFPIVGTLKENTFRYQGERYSLSRHGFARELEFAFKKTTDHQAIFSIISSKETLMRYPFSFKLDVRYSLEENILQVTYLVSNTGKQNMFFSLGAHPAFAVPLEPDTAYDDYYLKFSTIETAQRWPISLAGLIEVTPTPFLVNTDILTLSKDLFLQDAVVFKGLKSSKVSLKHRQRRHGLEFNFEGFPFLGIWAAKGADFLCIEPWCGIADSVDHDQDLTVKEGIENLPTGTSWERTWSVKLY